VEQLYMEQQMEREKNGETGFYVIPKMNCPHISQFQVITSGNPHAPCKVCQNVGENWICGECGEVYCKRTYGGT
jgi:uncharacterized UBP type Zn finger protein